MIIGCVLIFFLLVEVDIKTNWNGNVALELFNPLHDLKLGGSVEHVASSPKQKLKMLCHISSTNINSLYCIVD